MRENTLGDGGGGLEADKGRVRGDQLNLLYICPSRRLDRPRVQSVLAGVEEGHHNTYHLPARPDILYLDSSHHTQLSLRSCWCCWWKLLRVSQSSPRSIGRCTAVVQWSCTEVYSVWLELIIKYNYPCQSCNIQMCYKLVQNSVHCLPEQKEKIQRSTFHNIALDLGRKSPSTVRRRAHLAMKELYLMQLILADEFTRNSLRFTELWQQQDSANSFTTLMAQPSSH